MSISCVQKEKGKQTNKQINKPEKSLSQVPLEVNHKCDSSLQVIPLTNKDYFVPERIR